MSRDLNYTKEQLEHKFAEDFSNPTFPELAEIYFSEHDFARARQVCEIGLKHLSKNLEAQYILAKIELIEGHSIKAERILKNIYHVDANFIKATKLLIEVRDFLNRSKTETKKIIDYLKFFDEKNIPIFPIKGEDLMKKFDIPQGKKVGENLKLVEDYWINNNFKISDKELEKIVKN